MPKVTIDPKHVRLRAFLQGKRVRDAGVEATVDLSDDELASLLRKAESEGFEDLLSISLDDLEPAEPEPEPEVVVEEPEPIPVAAPEPEPEPAKKKAPSKKKSAPKKEESE